jgi:GT2 family glycosyltransferase
VIEKDNGQTDAINKGFKYSNGEIISWLNTDEYYYPYTLNKVIQYFNNNPNIDVVYGDCNFVDINGNNLRRRLVHKFDYNVLLYYGCYIPSCATFIRKRILKENLYLDTQYRVCMDFEYYVRLYKNNMRFGYLPEILSAFTLHDKNISNQLSQIRIRERLKVQTLYSNICRHVLLQKICLYTLKRIYQAKRALLLLQEYSISQIARSTHK